KYDVIYYSGDELPKVSDVGGAQSGRTGQGGGRQGFNRTQAIHVSRGEQLRERVVDAPKLNLPHSDAAVANLLAYKRVPGPPPAEGLKSALRALQAPQMDAIAPAPEVDRNQMQPAPALNSSVVPPAPAAQNLAALRLPGSHPMQVVPPPVSAPEDITNSNPKLTLPAQAVVAPAPAQVTREMTKGPGFGPGDIRNQVVPPPVQVGSDSGEMRNRASLGGTSAVPPPVQVGGGPMSHQPVSGLGGGVSAVPPPPMLSGGTSLTGRGSGSRGMGRGGAGEMGEVAAPPNGGGTGGGAGLVISNQPGSKVGVPGRGGVGALAMSPTGGANPGVGGSGGGAGIGRGVGPGSGLSGTGSGAGKDGSGRGADPNARGGTSPFSGPGGTGTGNSGAAMGGVSVSGGNGIVTLPSFGSDGAQQPNVPGRSSTGVDDRPGLSVEASPRSGGAFNFYGMLGGDKVYTIYIDTVLGTAVMELADPTSAAHPYAQGLAPPRPMRVDLPANVRRSRLVIACVLDRSGELRNLQVLESSGPEMASKVLAALPSWKFRPAMRHEQPVEVNAILGFAIDTRDR
ncbi:MAG TPA: energy transducer TonB, partial [Terracidiphilus sp.]